MALLFKSEVDRADHWAAAIKQHKPDLEVRIWPEAGEPRDIEYALVWKPPQGLLKRFPNLKAIFSLGAGIDHLTSDPELPREVPLVRMVEPGLSAGMAEFVAMSVLMHHRRMVDYLNMQREKMWAQLPVPLATRRRVGVMGQGAMGVASAEALVKLGFDVAGWSRRPKDVPGVASFQGQVFLDAFLARSEILVCLLPLTKQTQGILNAKTLGMLPKGAALINAARGELVADDDLLKALGTGQISGASLDVFNYEPLIPDHPYWIHPRVIVTPHCAAITVPETGAKAVVDNIHRLEAGGPLEHVVDPNQGY